MEKLGPHIEQDHSGAVSMLEPGQHFPFDSAPLEQDERLGSEDLSQTGAQGHPACRPELGPRAAAD
jgi:hypothetical protein